MTNRTAELAQILRNAIAESDPRRPYMSVPRAAVIEIERSMTPSSAVGEAYDKRSAEDASWAIEDLFDQARTGFSFRDDTEFCIAAEFFRSGHEAALAAISAPAAEQQGAPLVPIGAMPLFDLADTMMNHEGPVLPEHIREWCDEITQSDAAHSHDVVAHAWGIIGAYAGGPKDGLSDDVRALLEAHRAQQAVAAPVVQAAEQQVDALDAGGDHAFWTLIDQRPDDEPQLPPVRVDGHYTPQQLRNLALQAERALKRSAQKE